MLWENPGGAEVGRASGLGREWTFSHSHAYLEEAANTCKGALNSIYCHVRVILEITTHHWMLWVSWWRPMGLSAKHQGPTGHELGWATWLCTCCSFSLADSFLPFKCQPVCDPPSKQD